MLGWGLFVRLLSNVLLFVSESAQPQSRFVCNWVDQLRLICCRSQRLRSRLSLVRAPNRELALALQLELRTCCRRQPSNVLRISCCRDLLSLLPPTEDVGPIGLLLLQGKIFFLYGAVVYSVNNLLSQLAETALRNSPVIGVFIRRQSVRLKLGQISGHLGYFCYQSALRRQLRPAIVCQLNRRKVLLEGVIGVVCCCCEVEIQFLLLLTLPELLLG